LQDNYKVFHLCPSKVDENEEQTSTGAVLNDINVEVYFGKEKVINSVE